MHLLFKNGSNRISLLFKQYLLQNETKTLQNKNEQIQSLKLITDLNLSVGGALTIKYSSKTLHYNAVKTVKTDSDCKNCFVLKQIELYTENNILFI